MVRIAGVDVPDRKRAQVALRSIYGIGPVKAAEILTKLDLDPVQAPQLPPHPSVPQVALAHDGSQPARFCTSTTSVSESAVANTLTLYSMPRSILSLA